MIKFFNLFFSCCCLLLACQGPVKEADVPSKHQINQWKLESLGQQKWLLKAQSASEYNQRWKLKSFSWSNPSQDLMVSAPSAFQRDIDWIHIPEFKFHIKNFTGTGFKGLLNLKSMEFSGKVLLIQNSDSELKAESFKSKDLRKWNLQKVQMRFNRP